MNDTSRPVLTLKRKPKEQLSDGVTIPKFRNREVIEAKPRRHKNKSVQEKPVKSPVPEKKPKAPNPANVKKEKIPVPPTPPKKRMNIIEALSVIVGYWPALFPDGQLRPMKIGLKEDLLRDRKERNLPVSVKTLTRALSAISFAGGYRLTIVTGATRFDKDGQPAGIITAEEEAHSVARIEKIRKQQATRPDSGNNITNEVKK